MMLFTFLYAKYLVIMCYHLLKVNLNDILNLKPFLFAAFALLSFYYRILNIILNLNCISNAFFFIYYFLFQNIHTYLFCLIVRAIQIDYRGIRQSERCRVQSYRPLIKGCPRTLMEKVANNDRIRSVRAFHLEPC